MPHTNRARRADHFRSIDNKSNNNNNNKSYPTAPTDNAHDRNSGRTRVHHQHGGDDDGANSEPHHGPSDGRGGDGRGGSRRPQEATAGRGARRGGREGTGGRGARGPVPSKSSKGKAPSVKNRIRSLTRLMNRPGIVEEQRLSLKKQVEELEGKTAEREKHELERSLAIKYHKLKFFDRRKALRRLAQVHRKLKGAIDEDVRLELEQTRQSEETDLKYVLYFPKDKKYLPLEKGKEGPPRAQRSHERLLKAALERGEAAGWTEFQENLEKFVTGDRGRKKRANVAAVEGAATGGEGGKPSVKRKKALDGLAVVAQEKLWGDEEEEGDEGHAAGGGEGGESNGEIEDEDSGSEGRGGGRAKKVRPRVTPRGVNATTEEQSTKRKKTTLVLAPDGTGSSRSTESDLEVELSGDEGFGAAPSDEDDAYSFAEARMRWASGGGGGGGTVDAVAAASTTTSDDSSSDDGSSTGADATDGKTARGGLGSAGAASRQGVPSDGSQSDDSVGDIYVGGQTEGTRSVSYPDRSSDRSDGSVGDERPSSSEAAGLDGDSDDGSDKDSETGGVGLEGGGNAAGGGAGGGQGNRAAPSRGSDDDDDGSSSGDDIDLNDDFFLEEKASGSDDGNADGGGGGGGGADGANDSPNGLHHKRDGRRSAASGGRGGGGRRRSGRGERDRGGMGSGRGRAAGRGGRGGQGRGREDRGRDRGQGRGGRSYGSSGETGTGRRGGGTGGRRGRSDSGVTGASETGGRTVKGWVPHGRGGGGRRGGFAGTGGVAGRAGRGRGGRGERVEGGADGSVRLNKKIIFDDD